MMQKKFSWPITIGLICFLGLVLVGWRSPSIFLPGGTGVSDTLDEFFWGDTLKTKRNEAILSKTNEAVISKTVEKDKKGNIVKTIETIKYDDGKTLWDWGSLLGVSLSLAILGYILQEQQRKRADDETKEEVLQTYFDRLSVLLIDKKLIALFNKFNSSTIAPGEQELLDSAIDVIRARTLSILRRFKNDGERKGSVMKFLAETGIVGKSSKLELQGADLQGADLLWADLQGANLKGTNLKEAKLYEAKLQGADLCWAELERADLKGAKLNGADLSGANLNGAELERADLEDIQWDPKTVWLDKSAFAKAINIPEELKKELGITP